MTGLFHVERGLRNEPLVLLAGRPTPIGGASGMFHVERGWRNRAAGWNWEIWRKSGEDGSRSLRRRAKPAPDGSPRSRSGRTAGAAEQN